MKKRSESSRAYVCVEQKCEDRPFRLSKTYLRMPETRCPKSVQLSVLNCWSYA